MKGLIILNNDELRKLYGGKDIEVATGYPGQSLVNFIWSTIKAAYQHGYDDKLKNTEPCRQIKQLNIMNKYNLKHLEESELNDIRGGILPVIAYGAAYLTIYASAHAIAYYKGYSDAHKSLESCKQQL